MKFERTIPDRPDLHPTPMSSMLPRAAALAALLATPLAAGAQAPAPSGIPAGCTYATCALRLEQAWGMRIVRGASGERVGRIGGFGSGVDVLLAGTDSSRAHARRYQSNARVVSTLGLAALTTSVIALVRVNKHGEDDETARILGWSTLGIGLVSIPFAGRAQRSLSRSVWWYNAALAR